MSVARIWAIAANGFREAIRDRVLFVVLLFALLQVLALRFLPEISATTEDKILLDWGLGAMGLLSALVAIFLGTGLINKEIEKRTVLVLIPKPLSRAELILGKHLGLSCVLALLLATMAAIYYFSLSWAKIAYPATAIAIAIVYLLLELGLLVSAALLFGGFTNSILAILLTLGVYTAGHGSRSLVELGKLSENESIETIVGSIYLVLPDLSRLNLRNGAVYGALPSLPELLANAAYGVAYTSLLLAIAIAIFARRQF